MKKLLITVIAVVLSTMHLYCLDDALDYSKAQQEIIEYGIPTVATVNQLGKEADELYLLAKWKEAAGAYAVYAEHANRLANLISKGIEPYYSASYDDKKSFGYSQTQPLVKFENKSNYYKKRRDEAILRQGICFYKLGDHNQSLPYILKALDLINIKETEMWNEARTTLYEIIKYDE